MFPLLPRTRSNNSYQVTADDRDFLTLSANLGVDYNQLREANPYIQSISQGQYINLPTPPPTTPLYQAVQSGANFGVTPSQQNTAQRLALQTPRQSQPAPTGTYEDYAQRQGIQNLNFEALANQFASTGTLPGNLPDVAISWLVSQGADPNKIRQAQQKGAQTAASIGAASDPLEGTPGHYYVDETTAPFVGRLIMVRGKRRILRTDRNGRLYYQKPPQSRRGRAANRAYSRQKRAEAAAAQQAAAQQVLPIPDVNYRDAPVTALNVILGS